MLCIKLCICLFIFPAAIVYAQKDEEVLLNEHTSETSLPDITRKKNNRDIQKDLSYKQKLIEKSFSQRELLKINPAPSTSGIDISGSINKVVSFAGFYDGKVDFSHNSSLHIKPVHELEIYSVSHRHSVIPLAEIQSLTFTFAAETIALGAVETACSYLLSGNNIVKQTASFILNNSLKLAMDAFSSEKEGYSFYYVWIGIRF